MNKINLNHINSQEEKKNVKNGHKENYIFLMETLNEDDQVSRTRSMKRTT
jgi:hypothetical protein